ncbi:hypothetical protein P152DRAFT_144843 [Eremomyces bilateralis CBS 781.70]|uniref:Nuclear envelope protein n=1 Tax=Eremomyces bilateralis CBS 781.70 TaxID=1392243 RepID=A0A6G1FW24_9PEZI|nr:uncharacterized protein P152DRAFT_144843 [Eremomyces bilateralis CBS 781.70]KAF1809984.1 hypothetical protein P152DRAFT_144843 [Eremomyces bilateralis CBS 781.70]
MADIRAIPTARPYRNFLTPALHDRFVKAATVTCGVCLLIGPLMSHTERSWFLGPIRAIFRATVLFIPCLLFWIARLVNMHYGSELSNSPFHTFLHYISTTKRVQTYLWVVAATRLYAEIYMAYAGSEARYSWVEVGKAWERSKVNERYIFIAFMFSWLGLAKSTWHIYCDRDKLPIPIIKYKPQSEPKDLRPPPSPEPFSFANLRAAASKSLQSGLSESGVQMPGYSVSVRKHVQSVLLDSLSMTSFTVLSGTFLYATVFRQPLWYIQHQCLHYFYGVFYTLQKQSTPGPYPGLLDLVGRFTYQATLCNILLECASTAFTAYTAQGPTKRQKLLSEDSKDPNGSLILGLKAQKEMVRTMAFWELLDLTKTHVTRRGTIFEEIDRVGGSTWSQILTLCLKEMSDVSGRIEATKTPAEPKETNGTSKQPERPVIKTLPRLTPSIKTDNIFSPSPKSKSRQLAGEVAGSFIHEPRKTPSKWPHNFWTLVKEAVGSVIQLLSVITEYILRWPIVGLPFRTSMSRRAAFTLLSRPESPNYLLSWIPFISPTPCTLSDASNIADAATTLAGLLEASLREDRVGLVQKDVQRVVSTLTKTIADIEAFVNGMRPWPSDAELLFIDDTNSGDWLATLQTTKYQVLHEGEVGEVVQALKAALTSVLGSFAEYASSVGLSEAALKNAKDVLAAGETKPRKPARLPVPDREQNIGHSRPEMEHVNGRRRPIPKAPRFQPYTPAELEERRAAREPPAVKIIPYTEQELAERGGRL